MRCIPIVGPDIEAIKKQVARAGGIADILEWRLDLFQNCSIADLRPIRQSLPCPVIFTGGGSEYKKLCPDLIDGPEGEIISYHNFEEMPDLDALLLKMQESPAKYYKIACMAKSTLDALRMIDFAQKHQNVIGIAMGDKGTISRYFTKPWSYIALDEEHKTAPGQLTLQDPWGQKNLYGLIGGTVTQSPSHVTHNRFMKERGVDAFYLKMVVEKGELESFFHYAKKLGVKGLSVTIPLKEAVIPYLDEIDPKAAAIGAVNTILFKDGRMIGYNTDADAALDAIEEKGAVRGKRIAILGAGGAAKAIAYEAKARGATVIICHRQDAPPHDILVNTTPVSPEVTLVPGSVVMDITIMPQMTPLLERAEEAGCLIVPGYEMFIRQAIAQFRIWGLPSEQAHDQRDLLRAHQQGYLAPQAALYVSRGG